MTEKKVKLLCVCVRVCALRVFQVLAEDVPLPCLIYQNQQADVSDLEKLEKWGDSILNTSGGCSDIRMESLIIIKMESIY